LAAGEELGSGSLTETENKVGKINSADFQVLGFIQGEKSRLVEYMFYKSLI
jgi:hypothetical protein